METITKVAIQLLQEKWSIMEDSFRGNAATVLPPLPMHCPKKRP